MPKISMIMKKNLLVVCAAVVTFVAVSCASGVDANYKALTAHTWQLEQIVAPSDTSNVEMPPMPITITFGDSSSMSGFAGCNNFFGTFTTGAQSEISVNPVGRTMAYCEYIDFEDMFMIALPQCTSYSVSDKELELNDASGTTLKFKAKE